VLGARGFSAAGGDLVDLGAQVVDQRGQLARNSAERALRLVFSVLMAGGRRNETGAANTRARRKNPL